MVVTRNGTVISTTEDSVTVGRDHVPTGIAFGREIPSPVANVDTVPSMRLPQSAFERKFHAKPEAFKDLTLFEERLRHNMYEAQKTQTRWRTGFAILFSILAWCGYRILTNKRVDENGIPQQNSWHVLGVTVLISAFIIFATSGMLRKKLFDGHRYIDRCNSSLRPFNMEFNKGRKGEITFMRKVPPAFQDGYAKYKKGTEVKGKGGGKKDR